MKIKAIEPVVSKLMYALQSFIDYYEQAGIGWSTDDDGNDAFDRDEKLNVCMGRRAITQAKKFYRC